MKDKIPKALWQKKYWIANRERLRAYNRNYYDANKETIKLAAKKWKKSHRSRKRQLDAAWRHANPEKVRLCGARWRAAHPEKVRTKAATERVQRREYHARNRRFLNRPYLSKLCKQKFPALSGVPLPDSLLDAIKEKVKNDRTIRELETA